MTDPRSTYGVLAALSDEELVERTLRWARSSDPDLQQLADEAGGVLLGRLKTRAEVINFHDRRLLERCGKKARKAAQDAYAVREEVVRIVSEDRVPLDVLTELLHVYGEEA